MVWLILYARVSCLEEISTCSNHHHDQDFVGKQFYPGTNLISSCVLLLLTAHSDMNVVTILVGNKTDLEEAREVSTAEGKLLAEAQGLFFMETSALDSSNVKAAFETVVKEIYDILRRKVFQSQEHKKLESSSLGNGRTVVLQGGTGETDDKAARNWCCSSS